MVMMLGLALFAWAIGVSVIIPSLFSGVLVLLVVTVHAAGSHF
jgi:hypothetical protein